MKIIKLAANEAFIEKIKAEDPPVIVDPPSGAIIASALSSGTAVVNSSYPYSWDLRCIRRCWRERVPKKGTRWMIQTNNPKLPILQWNAVKKSTFAQGVMVLYVDEEGHVQRADFSPHDAYDSSKPDGHRYDDAELKAKEFIDKYGENVDEVDRQTIRQMLDAIQRYQAKQQAQLAAAPQPPQGQIP